MDAVWVQVGGLRLLLDPGTTELSESDGLLAKNAAPSLPTLRPSTLGVRLPSGERSTMGGVVEIPDDFGMRLTLSRTSLDFGSQFDGLIALSGIQRLEREHGLTVHWSAGVVFITHPQVALLSVEHHVADPVTPSADPTPRGAAKPFARRTQTALLRRLSMYQPHGYAGT